MRFIFVYPETSGTDADLLDSGGVAEVAIAAERAGWDGFAFTEHPIPGARWLAAGGHQTLDPFIALGHVAAVTKRLRLLTYLAVAPYRNPSLLAKAAMTVDRLSGGRFVLGLGTGYLKSEFHALGVDFEERNRLFDEALDVLPLHWAGEPFSYDGAHFSARDVIARPRPQQNPIPIWIGGNAKVTIERVAARAQGWMPLTSSAEVTTTARTPAVSGTAAIAAKVKELRALAGDRADTIDVAVSYGGGTASVVTIEVERHRDELGALEAAGATWAIVSGPAGPPEATLDFVQAFTATYGPS